MTFFAVHLSGSGQSSFLLQLQFSGVLPVSLLKILLLCALIIISMLLMQLQLIFSVFLLQILCSSFSFGKFLSISAGNFFQCLL